MINRSSKISFEKKNLALQMASQTDTTEAQMIQPAKLNAKGSEYLMTILLRRNIQLSTLQSVLEEYQPKLCAFLMTAKVVLRS